MNIMWQGIIIDFLIDLLSELNISLEDKNCLNKRCKHFEEDHFKQLSSDHRSKLERNITKYLVKFLFETWPAIHRGAMIWSQISQARLVHTTEKVAIMPLL